MDYYIIKIAFSQMAEINVNHPYSGYKPEVKFFCSH